MAISREDMNEIKSELDERYVMQGDCDSIQQKVNNKFANDDKRIDILLDRVGVFNKLLWLIASSSVGALLVAFIDLILK